MLELRELNDVDELERNELGKITGGVNYSLVRSYYSRTTKRAIRYTDDTLYRLKNLVAGIGIK
jgi:hypothetical protein